MLVMVRQNLKSTVFEDKLPAAKKVALRCLSRRDHSRHELAEKLYQKGFSKSTVSEIIHELEVMNLIDDTRFLETWSRFRIEHHHFGPLRLRQEFLKKGIPSADVAAHLQKISNVRDRADEVEKTLLHRYFDPSQLKEKNAQRRAFDFLRRKGHETEMIFKVFRKYKLM